MSRNAEELLGLMGSGKRIYRVDEDVVTEAEFQAQQLIHKLVFGERGLADTIGPTWEMIHDPRFEQLENVFIRRRSGIFGGDATTGVNTQSQDGSFNSSVDDLNQYSELLGEGRYFHAVLRSMSLYTAIATLFPDRKFTVHKQEVLPGISVFNRLSAEEQVQVEALAATFSEFNPHNLHKQTDEAIWGLIQQECPNYFSRTGVVNKTGENLFNMLRLDVVGLIDDYAEVAKIQEWVLLDQESTLVEPKHIEEELPRVWAEVEILERALTHRASLRSTAAQIMKTTGIAGILKTFDVDLTEFERDTLLRLIYTSDYPNDQTRLVTSISGYLAGIRATGLSAEQRSEIQCQKASQHSRAYVAKLKSGQIAPINRHTEETEEIEMTEEEKVAEQIMLDPIKQMVFIRYSAAEGRAEKLNLKINQITRDLEDVEGYTLSENERDVQKGIREEYREKVSGLNAVAALLAPVFERADFVLTEDAAAELLVKAEEFDSTVMDVQPHPQDTAAVVEADTVPAAECNKIPEGVAT